MSLGFITMKEYKYSHICNLWGKFLPAGMICTTTDTISIPVGEMYLHVRMFCALAHTFYIPMGAINFYMQECFLNSLIPLLFPWVQCQRLKPILSQCSQTGFATVDDFIALYTRSNVFYSHGCNKFTHARTFLTLTDTIDRTIFDRDNVINFYRDKFGPVLIKLWSQII